MERAETKQCAAEAAAVAATILAAEPDSGLLLSPATPSRRGAPVANTASEDARVLDDAASELLTMSTRSASKRKARPRRFDLVASGGAPSGPLAGMPGCDALERSFLEQERAGRPSRKASVRRSRPGSPF